jgi:multisubunit Na+/H+ antiporter MnhG subunit
MKKEHSTDESWAVFLAIFFFAPIFAVVNAAPIIGPGLWAFIIGFHKKKNGLEDFSKVHLLGSATFGGLFFIIAMLIIFRDPTNLFSTLNLLVANFFINFLSSLAFFSLGDYISRVKEAKRLTKFYGF